MKVVEQSLWYRDPRVWVLALAMLLFFFTLNETDREKRARKTVEVPSSASESLGSTGGSATGF